MVRRSRLVTVRAVRGPARFPRISPNTELNPTVISLVTGDSHGMHAHASILHTLVCSEFRANEIALWPHVSQAA